MFLVEVDYQIQNIQMPIMNMAIPNRMMEFPIMNMQMPNMQMMNNMNENPMNENKVFKYNVSFKSVYGGGNIVLMLDSNVTVKEMLENYLKRINKPELKNKIIFTFNASIINFNDNRKLKEFFKFYSDTITRIYVNY